MILFSNVESVAMERLRLKEKKGKRKIDKGGAFTYLKFKNRPHTLPFCTPTGKQKGIR